MNCDHQVMGWLDYLTIPSSHIYIFVFSLNIFYLFIYLYRPTRIQFDSFFIHVHMVMMEN